VTRRAFVATVFVATFRPLVRVLDAAPPGVMVYNWYFARPGTAERVLATRLEASRVRRTLGLPAGRTLQRIEGGESLPDVLWEAHFPSVAAHDRDMQARAASATFESVRARMTPQLTRFERLLYTVVDGAPSAASSGIVVVNLYTARPGRRDDVVAQRRLASDVRRRAGLPSGIISTRLTDASHVPDVIWSCDYPSAAARADDVAALERVAEWAPVPVRMSTLLDRFDRGVYRIIDA
jgi:hypothetical protein